MTKLVVIDESLPQARRWRWTVLACRLAEALHTGASVAEHVEAEHARVEREGGRAPTRQLLSRLMKRDDFKAKVEEQLGHLRHEDDLVRRGVQRKVEQEAVHAIRHQLRREVAADEGDVTACARLALEYAGVVGRNAAPAVTVDNRTQNVNVTASATPAQLVERARALLGDEAAARVEARLVPLVEDAPPATPQDT